MKTRPFLFTLPLLAAMVLLGSCKTNKPVVTQTEPTMEVDTAMAVVEPEYPYRPSRTRTWDLQHTELDVRFDWEKQFLMGKATLTLKPYFYAMDSLELDAKGFVINAVSLKKNGKMSALPYHYKDDKLQIKLDRKYIRSEKVDVWIDYVARPELRQTGGSEAITSDKGLYFINPLGTEPRKPKQIWTQGETEASSAWFPTIDAPNENMTQRITITVDDRYRTLSNGLMTSTQKNGDGTRTDVWAQDKLHAPYLAMMAIGEYSVISDKWGKMAVDYYVEKEYEPYARNIFGHTPEMLEFYSKVLGYRYAWDKYAQVVVRDYVSGAMENTTAVIHGEFIQQTDREMLDGDYEDVISHELFHHWFGDVVTCESWANLPLNESFATYGEYLWREYKYGRASADDHGQEQLGQYLAESRNKQVNLVRFHHDKQEDMFDSHSYAKGGRVLHMLRKAVGDSAFFNGLSLYLRTNQFKSVEMHQLRLAMEEVSGQDLNWFFDQWFYAKGHPDLRIESGYDPANSMAVVTITQQQDLASTPLYRIPMAIDLYYLGQEHRHMVVLDEEQQTFRFKVPSKPDLINVDGEKMLLCRKQETKSDAEWIFQFRNAPLYLDKAEALTALIQSNDSLAAACVLKALDNDYWHIRLMAIEGLDHVRTYMPKALATKLANLAANDAKADVRAASLAQLIKDPAGVDVAALCDKALKDPSYNVNGIGLMGIGKMDEAKALSTAQQMAADARGPLLSAIGSLYARKGGPEQLVFFQDAYMRITDPGQKYMFVQLMGKFLVKQGDEVMRKALPGLRDLAINEKAWWLRLAAIQVLSELSMKTQDSTIRDSIFAMISEIKTKEKDEKVLNFLGGQ